MFDIAGSRDRQHHRASLQDPGQRNLRRRGVMILGDAVQQRAWPGQIAGRQRIPGNKADAVLRAIIQRILAVARHQIIMVLHRGDGKDFARRLDVGHRDIAQSGLGDDPLVQQRLDGGELFVARDLGIDPVQLPERDAGDFEPLAAFLGGVDQIVGIAIGRPAIGTGAGQPALGGDQKPVIGMKRFPDQILRNLRPIGIGGIDEIHPQLRHPPQGCQRLSLVGRRAPYPLAGDAHGAKTQAMDPGFAADQKCARICCIRHDRSPEG